MNRHAEEISTILRENENFLVLTHKEPDGDALGSTLAIRQFLAEQWGKNVCMPAPVNWPGRYSFLKKHCNGNKIANPEDTDCILFLDSSSPDRIDWGDLDSDAFAAVPKVVIDHHEEGIPFGDINWIDKSSAAVGEMIYDILLDIGAEITPEIAECLYLAILTDTGRFTYSNTSAESLRISAELIEAGKIDPSEIASQVYFNYSEEYLRNIGIALYNSRTYRDARIVLLTLDKASVRSFSTTFDETEGIVDLAMSVRGVELAALFKEVSTNVNRVSMRSRGLVDIGALAKELGGGGHFNAAGCTLRMPLSLAREVILDRFERYLEDC